MIDVGVTSTSTYSLLYINIHMDGTKMNRDVHIHGILCIHTFPNPVCQEGLEAVSVLTKEYT